MVDQTLGRVLDLFDIEIPRLVRWSGLKAGLQSE
jgi:3-polyprenyl-4-hydroxybenzoate decarboxylase